MAFRGEECNAFCFEFAATVGTARGRVARSRAAKPAKWCRLPRPPPARSDGLLLTDPPRGVGAQSAPEVLSHETAERRGGSASRAAMGKPKASFFPLSSGHELLKQNGHLRSVASGSSSFFVVSDAPASVRPVAGKPSGKFLQKSPPWLIVGLPSPWNIVASTPRCLGWWAQ